MLTSHTNSTAPIADCLIIGGGPAGLTAAIYLARFRRKVVLIDAGGSRASLIASTQNYPGFPEGISGDALLERLGQQAVRFGARPVRGRVIGLAANGELFRANTDLGRVEARTIMLATGIVEAKPPLPGLIDLIRDGLIRLCPICDGYEVIDQQVTVIGNFAQAAGEALFLRTFTSSLKVLPLDPPAEWAPEKIAALGDAGIAVERDPLVSLRVEGGRIWTALASGNSYELGVLYAAMGATPRSELVKGLGVATFSEGSVRTDDHQESSVRNIFAAGDVVSSLNQITVATGHAAIAATAIHNRLSATRDSN